MEMSTKLPGLQRCSMQPEVSPEAPRTGVLMIRTPVAVNTPSNTVVNLASRSGSRI